MPPLPADCLNEIFEYLEDEVIALHSCLLVNRLWCEIAVRILWRDIWNYSTRNFRTLIACLPEKSKKILYDNRIIVPAPTLNPPMFNYASFCKVLSVNRVNYMIKQLLRTQQYHDIHIVERELYKLFMRQIPSLKGLIFDYDEWKILDMNLAAFPGAKDCLKNLTELNYRTYIPLKFLHHLSKICHHIKSLTIEFKELVVVSDELADLL